MWTAKLSFVFAVMGFVKSGSSFNQQYFSLAFQRLFPLFDTLIELVLSVAFAFFTYNKVLLRIVMH